MSISMRERERERERDFTLHNLLKPIEWMREGGTFSHSPISDCAEWVDPKYLNAGIFK